jgi:hypothetical protein
MTVGLRGILRIAAIVCFVLATLSFDLSLFHMTPLGLALFAASFMVPETEPSLADWDKPINEDA